MQLIRVVDQTPSSQIFKLTIVLLSVFVLLTNSLPSIDITHIIRNTHTHIPNVIVSDNNALGSHTVTHMIAYYPHVHIFTSRIVY